MQNPTETKSGIEQFLRCLTHPAAFVDIYQHPVTNLVEKWRKGLGVGQT